MYLAAYTQYSTFYQSLIACNYDSLCLVATRLLCDRVELTIMTNLHNILMYNLFLL